MDRDKGSTLLSIMAAVLILSVMMTTLVTMSLQDMVTTGRMLETSNGLMDARTAVQVVYKELQGNWTQSSFNSVSDAKKALQLLQTSVNDWCSQHFRNAPFQATVSLGKGNLDGASSTSLASVYQDFMIEVDFQSAGVAKKMTDIVTISGIIDALNYALYTPGNLFVCGAPQIDGRLSAGGSLFIDRQPWEGVVGRNGQSYLMYEGNPVTFYRQYDTSYEPNVLATLGSGSSISYKTGMYSFSQFKDQHGLSDGTKEFGDGSNVNDASAINVNNLSQYISGSNQVTAYRSSLPDDYVHQIVAENDDQLKKSAQDIDSVHYGQFKHEDSLPLGGGYVKYPKGQGAYDVNKPTNVTGPLYFDGNLTIDKGATLNLTQPLFVNGDLVINGTLNSTATVFVGGTTTITNVPTDNPGTIPSRIEIFCSNDIDLTLLSGNGVGPANAATTLYAFLASDTNIYLEGMNSFYHIVGGVAGRNIILNGTVGAGQRNDGAYLQSTNLSDHSPRLWITYDNSYVSNPLAGTPTISDLKVQPLPQPTLLTQ